MFLVSVLFSHKFTVWRHCQKCLIPPSLPPSPFTLPFPLSLTSYRLHFMLNSLFIFLIFFLTFIYLNSVFIRESHSQTCNVRQPVDNLYITLSNRLSRRVLLLEKFNSSIDYRPKLSFSLPLSFFSFQNRASEKNNNNNNKWTLNK